MYLSETEKQKEGILKLDRLMSLMIKVNVLAVYNFRSSYWLLIASEIRWNSEKNGKLS